MIQKVFAHLPDTTLEAITKLQTRRKHGCTTFNLHQRVPRMVEIHYLHGKCMSTWIWGRASVTNSEGSWYRTTATMTKKKIHARVVIFMGVSKPIVFWHVHDLNWTEHTARTSADVLALHTAILDFILVPLLRKFFRGWNVKLTAIQHTVHNLDLWISICFRRHRFAANNEKKEVCLPWRSAEADGIRNLEDLHT
jgi:hypothetical protein